MKKGLPLLGVALVLVVLSLSVGVAVDGNVQELPQTSSADSGPNGMQEANDANIANQDQNSNSTEADSNILEIIAALLGMPADSDSQSSNQKTTRAEPEVTIGHGAGEVAPSYRTQKVIGTSASGLEFSGLFQANTEQTYAYFKNKGLNTIRIPFDWNEMQPDLYGQFDETSKGYLDQNIAWAKKYGLSVILDAHNYGRRYIYRDGGFTDDFSSSKQHTFQMPYGDQDSTNGTLTFRDFGRGVAGSFTNPAAPATGYATTFDAKIDAYSGDLWNEFYMDVMYKDDSNRYSLAINPVINGWALRQTINGTTTVLASGTKAWNTGQYYSFAIDVGQSQAGKINVSVDGSPLFAPNSVNSNAALSTGKVSMYPSGVTATIKDFVLNVAGDTVTGGPIERRITEDGLPIEAWKDLWTKIAAAYKDDSTVIGYDENEPYNMPVPTDPTNYSAAVAAKNGKSIATATLIGQAMVDALRAAGDTKFVSINMDHWANTHYFTTQYGPNPEPWIIDSLKYSKVVYSGHYYFDQDHSGFYAVGSSPRTNEQITAEVEPFFAWCKDQKQICYIGEFGVPNTPEWQPAMTHFMKLMKQYDIWWAQWAGGNTYSSQTTMQPTNAFATDQLQMTTIESFVKEHYK